MRKLWIVSACLLWASSSFAQGYLTPNIPQPYNAVPPGPNGIGIAAPTDNTFVPANAAQRQTVQRVTVNTDVNGNWSVTWANSFISSTPTVNPIPLNAGAANPYTCNVTTRSATAATGKCWQITSQTVALISLTISLSPTNAPISVPIMVIGAEPTQ